MNLRSLHVLLLIVSFGTVVLPQVPASSTPESSTGNMRLPSGKLQRDEMIKADHARNLEDAESLIKLAEELKGEMEKNSQFVLSVSSMKKTEEIEKLAKRIRSRMKRF